MSSLMSIGKCKLNCDCNHEEKLKKSQIQKQYSITLKRKKFDTTKQKTN